MIIKSLSRTSGRPWRQLVTYVNRREAVCDRPGFTFNMLSPTDDPKGVAAELEEHWRDRTPKRKGGVVLHHEVLSLGVGEKVTPELLEDLARAYVGQRAPDCLVFGQVHVSPNPHVHLLISPGTLDGKRHHLTRAQFARAKTATEAYQRERYPELERSQVRHGKRREQRRTWREREAERRARKDRGEDGLDQRPGWQPGTREEEQRLRREAVLDACCTGSFAAAKTRLAREELAFYERGGRIAGIVDAKGRKHRFKTMGLDMAFREAADAWMVRSRNRERTQEEQPE